MTKRIDYRNALGRFTTGVTVVTAAHGGERFAMTASALTSVSLDPILLLVCFGHDSDTRVAVRESGRFGLSVFGERGATTAKRLAGKSEPGADPLAGLEVDTGLHGVPLLADALAQCVCSVERIVRGGDHDVVVGEVGWIGRGRADLNPLVYYDGSFWNLAQFDDVASAGG